MQRHRIAWPLMALLAGASSAAAQIPSAGRVDVAILSAPEITHPASEPLLLRVSLSNRAARRVAAENISNERQAALVAQRPKFKELSPRERAQLLARYAPRPVPAVTLGAPNRALADFIRFEARDERGNVIPLAIRALAGQDTRGSVRLDERRTPLLAFGVDAAAMAGLRPGVYVLRAGIDTSGERGMWAGRSSSEPVTLRVAAPPAREAAAARLARLKQSAGFFLADAQFKEAESRARDIIASSASDVQGWVLLGDALDGAGQHQQALDTFRQALKLANARGTGADREPPAYIEERILEIQASLQRR